MEEEVVSLHLCRKFSSILWEAEEDRSQLRQIVSRFRSIEGRINAMYNNNSVSSIPVELLYELIDALVECRIFAHERHKAAASKKGFFRVTTFDPLTHFVFNKNMIKRLDDVEMKLKSSHHLQGPPESSSLSSSPPRLIIPQSTYPIPDASEIIGFESEAERIETWLMANNNSAAASSSRKEAADEEFTAIGIVGRRCGCGKTSLAHKIFASPRVQAEFYPIVWVSLSNMLLDNESLDPRVRVVIDILKKICHENNLSVLEDADISVVKLLEKLQRELMGKRYLIVLDDAWEVDEWFGDLGYRLPRGYPMGEFFSHGLPKGSGGAIIVTSQWESVIKRMAGDKHVINLETKLSDEICWEIFLDHVRRQGKVSLDHPKLKELEEDVIRKCDGLPLAAKILAHIIPSLL